jgi:glucose-1-phosphate thymidylyltransferase
MQYLVDGLILAGVRRFLIAISDNKWDIVRYYGSGKSFGVSITYLFQEDAAGMPGALDLARPWLQEDDTVLFGMPDTIVTPAEVFSRLLRHHQRTRADLSLGLFTTSSPKRFGMTRMDETGHLTTFVDKPTRTDLAHMWGIGCWGFAFAQLLGEKLLQHSTEGEPVLSDFFAIALKEGLEVVGLHFPDGSYLDIGTPADLVSATRLFTQVGAQEQDRPRSQ